MYEFIYAGFFLTRKSLFLISELAPRVFYKLRNLKTLDLSENHLQFLSGAVFADVPNLETLICESCGVFQVIILQTHQLR